MVGSKPITQSSVIAINNAYAKGSLSIKFVDRNAAGVPGRERQHHEPAGPERSRRTSTGCVVFDGLNSGVYFGSVLEDRLRRRRGRSERSFAGQRLERHDRRHGVSTYIYDQAGSANFRFAEARTHRDDCTSSTPTATGGHGQAQRHARARLQRQAFAPAPRAHLRVRSSR